MVIALLLAAAAQPPPVALMPLRALGVPADVAHALEETLRNELSALPEARVVPPNGLAEALKREPECEARLPCAALAAQKVGAERFITMTASQLGDAFMIDLKLVDARTANELRRATRPVSGSQDGLIESLREAAVELLAPTRFVGALQLDVPGAPGALVFIDGKAAGAAPLAKPLDGLAPGPHTVRVADARSREVSTFVEIKYGRTTQARIELGPERVVQAGLPQNRWLRPAGWAGLGLGAASLLAGVAFQARAYATAGEINRRADTQQLLPSDDAAYRAVDRDTSRARAFYAVGAVLGLAGGVALYWDWKLTASPTQLGIAKRF